MPKPPRPASDAIDATGRPQQMTIRLSAEEHQALKTYAFVTGRTMNEAARQAIAEFLVGAGRDEVFEEALEDFRTRYRVALDKLKDL
ncbi:MAG TPA: DNA-binding protein [Acidimicrobiia bacterium]|nr:DNA-binding protein [Acidimicrobiia bacterium]